MILEVPQLQVIDRLRDYSSCASDAMGLRLSLRGSGVRVHCRARWCADTSSWAAIVLSLSVVLVLVCLCSDLPIWATIVLSLSVVLVLVCFCADTPIWATIVLSLSMVLLLACLCADTPIWASIALWLSLVWCSCSFLSWRKDSSLGLPVQLTIEIVQLQPIEFDGRLCMFLGCRRGEDSRAPQF